MSYISRGRPLLDEQVRIASTKMDGIGPKKVIQFRYRLGTRANNAALMYWSEAAQAISACT